MVGDTVRVEAIAAIRLLGRFELRIDGVAVPSMDSVRVESLLAYLLLNRDVDVSRQRLAVLLWPDSTDVQARTNLRHVLHTLRRRLPDVERYLEIGPRFVGVATRRTGSTLPALTGCSPLMRTDPTAMTG